MLPDGTPQLLAPTDYGARVVQPSADRTWVDVRANGQVMDAVLDNEGHVVALVRTDHGEFFVQRVRPDGSQVWKKRIAGPSYRSRLLADASGRVFLTGDQLLIRVDDQSGDHVSDAGPGESAVMCPDGRVGFSSYDPDRHIRDWKLFDLDTGAVETAISGTDDMWNLLHSPLGVDAAGRTRGVSWRRPVKSSGDLGPGVASMRRRSHAYVKITVGTSSRP